MISCLSPLLVCASSAVLGGGLLGSTPSLCAEAMIAGVDPGGDLADQETAAAAGGLPPAPRNSPPPRCQPDPQAGQQEAGLD